jgi:hypothetical protein
MYTQYVMHVYCLSMQRNQSTSGKSVELKHVHGILFIIDHFFVMLRPVKACFKRRASHLPNALETIDNEAFQLIIYCF